MQPQLLDLLRELEQFGKANDASTESRSQKTLNITHDTGVIEGTPPPRRPCISDQAHVTQRP